jgi:hypothetical protein
MPLWQRTLITLIAMLAVSFLVGYFWNTIFNFPLPSYVSGVVGGVTAVSVWEFLKRVKPK